VLEWYVWKRGQKAKAKVCTLYFFLGETVLPLFGALRTYHC
jgi:hypothetical protein